MAVRIPFRAFLFYSMQVLACCSVPFGILWADPTGWSTPIFKYLLQSRLRMEIPPATATELYLPSEFYDGVAKPGSWCAIASEASKAHCNMITESARMMLATAVANCHLEALGKPGIEWSNDIRLGGASDADITLVFIVSTHLEDVCRKTGSSWQFALVTEQTSFMAGIKTQLDEVMEAAARMETMQRKMDEGAHWMKKVGSRVEEFERKTNQQMANVDQSTKNLAEQLRELRKLSRTAGESQAQQMSNVQSVLERLNDLSSRALEESVDEHVDGKVAANVRQRPLVWQFGSHILAVVVSSSAAFIASWTICAAGYTNSLLCVTFMLLVGRLAAETIGIVPPPPGSAPGLSLAKWVLFRAAHSMSYSTMLAFGLVPIGCSVSPTVSRSVQLFRASALAAYENKPGRRSRQGQLESKNRGLVEDRLDRTARLCRADDNPVPPEPNCRRGSRRGLDEPRHGGTATECFYATQSNVRNVPYMSGTAHMRRTRDAPIQRRECLSGARHPSLAGTRSHRSWERAFGEPEPIKTRAGTNAPGIPGREVGDPDRRNGLGFGMDSRPKSTRNTQTAVRASHIPRPQSDNIFLLHGSTTRGWIS